MMRASVRAASALIPLLLVATPARAQDVALDELKRGFAAVQAWQIDEARELAEALYTKQPEHPFVLALVAEVKLHMSDYGGAVEFFERAKKAGAPDMILQDAGLAEAARVATQGYAESVSENFIIRYEPGKDSILVPYAIETLEAALDKIGTLLGWKPRSRIVVEFYPSAATLAAVSTLTKEEIANSGTIALCKWNRLMVTSPRAVLFGYGWRDTVAHELVHLIIGGASGNTVPIWLHEGIAKFSETAWRSEPGLALSVSQQEALQKAAKSNKLIPFEKMHPSMAKLKTQEESGLAFAEVFTFIEYMVEKKGWAGIRAVLSKMKDGASDAQAVEMVFGKPLKKLSKVWMATLADRPIRSQGSVRTSDREVVVKERADAPDDKLHGLSKKARRFARAADLLYARGRLRAAQRELEKAYNETKSPLLGAKLANVAMASGDLEAAEKAARAAIEGVPDLPGPHVTLAEILVRKGEMEGVAEPLEAAIAINPFDPRIHSLKLAALGPDGDNKKKMEAQLALAALTSGSRARPPILGTGGLVEIDGVPFARVFVEKQTDYGKRLVPTSMITPTAPIALKPGTTQIRLVPPTGEPVTQTITVAPTRADGRPQRIAADTTGS